jgi:hypothetical protein
VARAAVPRVAPAPGAARPGLLGALPYPVWALAGAAYLGVLLLADRHATYPEQLALGALTCAIVVGLLASLPLQLAVMTVGVIAFATVGEVIASIIWGVYTYRLENLPLFVPPAHGIVYLTGVAVALSLRRHPRVVVWVAAVAVGAWGLLGLTVLPRLDVAGAVGAVVLLAILLRSRNAAVYAGVFLVVAALELYGTAIGTWRWAVEVPGTGIPIGNPPSGVAAGYVWFDVMALLVAPFLLRLAHAARERARPEADRALPSSSPA